MGTFGVHIELSRNCCAEGGDTIVMRLAFGFAIVALLAASMEVEGHSVRGKVKGKGKGKGKIAKRNVVCF